MCPFPLYFAPALHNVFACHCAQLVYCVSVIDWKADYICASCPKKSDKYRAMKIDTGKPFIWNILDFELVTIAKRSLSNSWLRCRCRLSNHSHTYIDTCVQSSTHQHDLKTRALTQQGYFCSLLSDTLLSGSHTPTGCRGQSLLNKEHFPFAVYIFMVRVQI